MTVPTFVQASAGVTITATTGNPILNGATVGNIIILQVLVDTSAAFPIMSGTGIEKLDGTDGDMDLISGIQVGAGDNGAMRTWIGRATDATVDIDVDTNGSTNDMFCRLYEFSGVSKSPVATAVYESSVSQNQGTGTSLGDADPTSTVVEGLFLQLVGVTASQALGDFTGETGGNWTEAVAEYIGGGTVGTIQLQTATRSAPGTPGTVGGGTITITSNPWGVQGLVLKPPARELAPVAAYSFDSGAVVDRTRRGKDGTLTNSPTFPAGKYNAAFACASASSQYATISDHEDFTLGTQWTIMCWVNLTSVSAAAHEFVCKQNQWWFSCDNLQWYHGFYKSIGGTKSCASVSASSTLVGSWNHIACRYNNDQISLVKNGVQDAIDGVSEAFTMIDNSNPVRMGSWDGASEFLNGMIDDVRIYNVWLTDAEITALMNDPVDNMSHTGFLSAVGW